jgi:hypothetical protein
MMARRHANVRNPFARAQAKQHRHRAELDVVLSSSTTCTKTGSKENAKAHSGMIGRLIKCCPSKEEGIVGAGVEALFIYMVEVSYDSNWPAFCG